MAEHRVELVQLLDAFARSAAASRPRACATSRDLLVVVRQELVERRIEQADRDRAARPSPGRSRRSRSRCIGRSFASARSRGRSSRRRGSSRAPRGCGPARRTCARCGTGRCPRRRTRARRCASRGVSALVRTRERAELVGPASCSSANVAAELGRRRSATSPSITSPVRAVERDHVAGAHDVGRRTRSSPRRVVDAQRAAAGDAALAHAARHDGGVRGHAAARGEDALRGVHAVDVLGRGLDADEDHLLAALGARLGLVGGEDDLARRRAGRRGQALGERPCARAFGSSVGCSSWSSARGSTRAPPPRARSGPPSPCRRRSSRRRGAVRLPVRVCSM